MEKTKVAPDVFLASCVWKFDREIGEAHGVTYSDMINFIGKFDIFRGLDDRVLRAICNRYVIKLSDYQILRQEWQKVDGKFVSVYSIADEARGVVKKHYEGMLETISDSLDYDTKEFLKKEFPKLNGEFYLSDLYRNMEQIVNSEKFLLIKQRERKDNSLKFKYEITPIGRDCIAKMNYLKEKRANNFEPLYFGD